MIVDSWLVAKRQRKKTIFRLTRVQKLRLRSSLYRVPRKQIRLADDRLSLIESHRSQGGLCYHDFSQDKYTFYIYMYACVYSIERSYSRSRANVYERGSVITIQMIDRDKNIFMSDWISFFSDWLRFFFLFFYHDDREIKGSQKGNLSKFTFKRCEVDFGRSFLGIIKVLTLDLRYGHDFSDIFEF